MKRQNSKSRGDFSQQLLKLRSQNFKEEILKKNAEHTKRNSVSKFFSSNDPLNFEKADFGKLKNNENSLKLVVGPKRETQTTKEISDNLRKDLSSQEKLREHQESFASFHQLFAPTPKSSFSPTKSSFQPNQSSSKFQNSRPNNSSSIKKPFTFSSWRQPSDVPKKITSNTNLRLAKKKASLTEIISFQESGKQQSKSEISLRLITNTKVAGSSSKLRIPRTNNYTKSSYSNFRIWNYVTATERASEMRFQQFKDKIRNERLQTQPSFLHKNLKSNLTVEKSQLASILKRIPIHRFIRSSLPVALFTPSGVPVPSSSCNTVML